MYLRMLKRICRGEGMRKEDKSSSAQAGLQTQMDHYLEEEVAQWKKKR